jgi:hypothetical protein
VTNTVPAGGVVEHAVDEPMAVFDELATDRTRLVTARIPPGRMRS